MNADNANKWLSLGANIGVVIGLILLLIELDQNSDLVRAQIHQARADNWVSNRIEFANSELLLPVYVKLRNASQDAGVIFDPDALDDLDPVEYQRIYRYATAYAGDYDNTWYQYEQGYLDEDYYRYRIAPSMKRWAPVWQHIGALQHMRPSFVEEVRRLNEED